MTDITVSECKQQLNEANYTIKYQCGDIVVKDPATRSGVVGNNILLPQSDKEAIWKDGVKTIVKCDPQDTWNKEAALALCYMKRAHMNRGAFNETLKKWCV